MLKDKITAKQAISMMILFQLGSSLVTGASMLADQDSWISVAIALVAAIPIMLMYARINKLVLNKDIFEISYFAFGKIFGAVITFLFAIYSFHLGTLVIKNFTEYIQVMSLPETPQLVSAIFIGMICFFAIRNGIEVFARFAAFMMPIAMFVIIILLSFSAKYMNVSNLRPFLSHDIKLIFNEAFSALAFPFAETVLFISVFSAVEDKNSLSSKYMTALMAGGTALIILVMGNIMVLGFPLVKALYFPSYETASIIDIGNFISRIEVLVSGNFIVFGLTKVTICLYVACKGIVKLFKIKSFKITAAVVSFLMVVVSQVLYENTMQMFTLIRAYKYYAPIFEILIPLAILIMLPIKAKKANPSQA